MYDYSTMSDQDLGDLIALPQETAPHRYQLSRDKYGPMIPILPAAGLFTAGGRTNQS